MVMVAFLVMRICCTHYEHISNTLHTRKKSGQNSVVEHQTFAQTELIVLIRQKIKTMIN